MLEADMHASMQHPCGHAHPVSIRGTPVCSVLKVQIFVQGAGDSAFVGQNQLFPFSTVVFTSWDHHLTDVKAARNLRNSIRNQLAEMVFDAELADAYISKRKRVTSLLLKARLPHLQTCLTYVCQTRSLFPTPACAHQIVIK